MTLIKQIHNKLRQEYDWYRIWHNFKYATIFHFIMLIVTTFAISAITLSQMKLDFMDQNKISFSMSSSDVLTIQTQWQAGTYTDSTDLTAVAGNVQVFPESEINGSVGTITTTGNGDVADLHDGNLSTGIDLNPGDDILWDFGELVSNVTKYRFYRTGGPDSDVASDICLYPQNGFIFTCAGVGRPTWGILSVFGDGNLTKNEWKEFDIADDDFSQFWIDNGDSVNFTISELEAYYLPLTATHTSASTQIGDVSSDLGRYVVEYNGFDTTETEPANTTIDYRFQLVNSSGVSTDGWTSWASGDVADLATTYPSQLTLSQTKIDASETYLQVQSRLTSTDGVSTPTLSDYTASFHTNKPPNAPTPQ